MKYRVIKEYGFYKIQVKCLFTFWLWETCAMFGGSFGNDDYKFKSIEEANDWIKNN